MEKEFWFSVTSTVELSIPAESEEEARSKVGEYLAEYYADTKVSPTPDEVTLIDY